MPSIHSKSPNYTEGMLSNFPSAIDTWDNLYKATNNASTTTTAALSFNGAVLPVKSTDGFPDSGLLKIDREIVYYAHKTDNTFIGLSRGFVGTPRSRHASGVQVTAPIMGEHHNSLKDAILNIESYVGIASDISSNTLTGRVYSALAKWSVPQAAFLANKTYGALPLTVSFTDISNGGPIRWHWDFGDGHISSDRDPSHTYNDAGTYTVQLSITTSGRGVSTTTKRDYIVVDQQNTSIMVYIDPTTGPAPLNVSFYDQTKGDITSRLWIFGDGSKYSTTDPHDNTIIHQYTSAGTYAPMLQVETSNGDVVSDFLLQIVAT